MGIPAFMVTASLNCIIGQRLVRKATDLVPLPTPKPLTKFVQGLKNRFKKALPGEQFPYEGVVYSLENQPETSATYYHGRTGIYECVTLDMQLKQAILDGHTTI